MKLSIFWFIVFWSASIFGETRAVEAPRRENVLAAMEKVADWQIARPWPNQQLLPERESEFGLTSWRAGVYFTGLSALGDVSPQRKYRDALLEWATKNRWLGGRRLTSPDDQAVLQPYLELYLRSRNPLLLDQARKVGEAQIADVRPGREIWHWSDAFFMGPPFWALLSRATGDGRYIDRLDGHFFDAADALFFPDEQLFFRDAQKKDLRDAAGHHVFWGRGNGWALAGVARILKYLPPDHARRKDYVILLTKLAERLAGLQQPDGFWKSSLLAPKLHPVGEVSATGLICYGLALGVNEKVLDPKKFRPVIYSAWEALTSAADTEGKLGSTQGGGDAPWPVHAGHTEIYGVGAFLLAGSEVFKMLPEETR